MSSVWSEWSGRWPVVRELFYFLWRQRLFWMIPVVVMLFLVGFFVVVAQQSAVAPFIYAIF